MQNLTQDADFGLCDGLCAGIALEERQSSRSCWIGKDLSELREQNHQERMDLVFVTYHILTELLLQTHQFPIDCYLLSRHIAKAGLTTEERTRNCRGVHLIRFGSQTSLLGKGMHLSWM